MNETNFYFDAIAKMCKTARRFDLVGLLFDYTPETNTPRQYILNAFAMLMEAMREPRWLEKHRDDNLGLPFLVSLRALQAAYHLGVRDGARGTVAPHPYHWPQ